MTGYICINSFSKSLCFIAQGAVSWTPFGTYSALMKCDWLHSIVLNGASQPWSLHAKPINQLNPDSFI